MLPLWRRGGQHNKYLRTTGLREELQRQRPLGVEAQACEQLGPSLLLLLLMLLLQLQQMSLPLVSVSFVSVGCCPLPSPPPWSAPCAFRLGSGPPPGGAPAAGGSPSRAPHAISSIAVYVPICFKASVATTRDNCSNSLCSARCIGDGGAGVWLPLSDSSSDTEGAPTSGRRRPFPAAPAAAPAALGGAPPRPPSGCCCFSSPSPLGRRRAAAAAAAAAAAEACGVGGAVGRAAMRLGLE